MYKDQYFFFLEHNTKINIFVIFSLLDYQCSLIILCILSTIIHIHYAIYASCFRETRYPKEVDSSLTVAGASRATVTIRFVGDLGGDA